MNIILLNLHILGAGFSLALAVFAAVFLIHKPSVKERLDIARTLVKATAVALVWLIITGAGLFTERPQDHSSTILFWVKVGLLVLDIIYGFVLVNKKLKIIELKKPEKAVRLVSLIVWAIVNIIVIILVSALSINIGK
jgi:hypothetical protein